MAVRRFAPDYSLGRDADHVSRALIILGLVLVAAGLAIRFGLPLGRLPGDIVIHRGNSTLYFPVVTCIVVSLVLSLLAALMRRL